MVKLNKTQIIVLNEIQLKGAMLQCNISEPFSQKRKQADKLVKQGLLVKTETYWVTTYKAAEGIII